ncbi:MAG: hypothetical protein N2043_01990 [Ignavibacterium sp.]|nr:hypothetical protein [Ignavibacterium sp.]
MKKKKNINPYTNEYINKKTTDPNSDYTHPDISRIDEKKQELLIQCLKEGHDTRCVHYIDNGLLMFGDYSFKEKDYFYYFRNKKIKFKKKVVIV